jgi:hypothetical protein
MTNTDIKETFHELDEDISHEMICGVVDVVVVLILTLVYIHFMNSIIRSGKNEI